MSRRVDPNERGRRGIGPAAFVGVAAIGAALIVIGALVGWQRWSNRAAPAIDDLLPRLVADTAAAEPDAPPDVADDTTDRPGEPALAGGQPATDVGTPTPHVTAPGASAAAGDASVTPGSSSEAELFIDTTAVVHVSGAVAVPGVVNVAADARVIDAVDAAGSALVDADLDRINLAAPIRDGQHIYVPTIGEQDLPVMIDNNPVGTNPGAWPAAVATPSIGAVSSAGPIDLNRATVAELERLPGVGPAIAQAIVDLRLARGPYASVDELTLVGGIGATKVEQIRPHAFVLVGP